MARGDVVLGGTATLSVGTAANNLVAIEGTVNGTDAMTLGITPDDAAVPGGGGVLVSQNGQFVDYSFSFTTYADSVTNQFLRGSNGRRLFFRYGVMGKTYTGEAVCTTSVTYQFNPSRIMYTVTMTADGAVTVA